jgi:uncharacterized membrane protein
MIVCGSALLGVLLVDLSARVDGEVLARWPRLFGANAESSRGMLAAIAGSMITVAGVTFSITMLAVTQASAQYSPRILRNFMRDRPSQVVLGGLAGVFTYCLVVLRTIRDGDHGFVPSIAVLTGFVLAAVGIALLIYFVHHIASALQVASIISRVANDTNKAVRELFPQEMGEPVKEPPEIVADGPEVEWLPIPFHRTGYVQHVDSDALMEIAEDLETVIRVEKNIGEFIVAGSPIVTIMVTPRIGSEGRKARRERRASDIGDAFEVGPHRTVEQDPAFGVSQLVDIARKALSPGINDPATALTCIDYLSWIMARAARRSEVAAWREKDGQLRVIARGATFETLLDGAFDEIRRYAGGHVSVLERLLDALESIGEAAGNDRRRDRLERHVDMIIEVIGRTVPAPTDRAELIARADAVKETLVRLPRDGED